MTQTVGAGIGGSLITAPQAVWGGTPVFTSARTPTIKTATATWNQHPVQGGTYLRNGAFVDIGSARVLLYTDAMMTATGDVMNSGYALWLAAALGTTATMTQLGTTTAYELGGASAAAIGLPDQNGTFIDAQMNSPLDTGLLETWTYHSGIVSKSEWVFDATAIVSYSHDLAFQFVENSTTLTAPTEPAAPIPFTITNAASAFKMGVLGSEAAVVGVKKATVTIERKLATDRIYIGQTLVQVPVSNDNAKITVALEWDNTVNANASIVPLQLAGTPTSIICSAVGSAIGTSGRSNTFSLNATNCFLDTGGEQKLDGPGIVGNTASFSGTIPTAGTTPFTATLISPDTTF